MSTIFNNEAGATAIEYGLIAALIAVAIIAALDTLGSNAADTFSTVADEMGSAGSDDSGGS
ncbi:MAG: Flp family type IVb pilin [Pseudomonadota bacterium]